MTTKLGTILVGGSCEYTIVNDKGEYIIRDFEGKVWSTPDIAVLRYEYGRMLSDEVQQILKDAEDRHFHIEDEGR